MYAIRPSHSERGVVLLPGYFCPAESSVSTAVPCPAKFYRPMPGARSQQDCAMCPAGSLGVNGTAVPVPCPRGQYCVRGVCTYFDTAYVVV